MTAATAIITLTTDFGQADPYVAAIKGVILGITPRAVLVDVSHSIQPQNVLQGAFLLSTVYAYFPPEAIHIVVVDPGVGTGRRALLVATPQGRFLAPDNGVLSYLVAGPRVAQAAEAVPWLRPGVRQPPLHEMRLGEGVRAYALIRPEWWRHPVSATFHGRDIFAPVAAHLSLGVSPQELGEPVTSIYAFPIPRPCQAAGRLVGHVLHVDVFGNLITDIREADLPPGQLRLEVKGRAIQGLSSSYAEGGELLALVGSSGYVEIAAREASASRLLEAGGGDEVTVVPL